MTTPERSVDTICQCRKGSMDDKQFRATVEYNIQSLLTAERQKREEVVEAERERHTQTLSALATMWNQYCSNENGHEFMSAGEKASVGVKYSGVIILVPLLSLRNSVPNLKGEGLF